MELAITAPEAIQADPLTQIRTDSRRLVAHLARGRVRIETAVALAESAAKFSESPPNRDELMRMYETTRAELRGSSEPWVDAASTLVRILVGGAKFHSPRSAMEAKRGGQFSAIWIPTGATIRAPMMPIGLIAAALVRHAGSLAGLARKAHPRALPRDIVRALQDWCPELPEAPPEPLPDDAAGVIWVGDVAVIQPIQPVARPEPASGWRPEWKRKIRW